MKQFNPKRYIDASFDPDSMKAVYDILQSSTRKLVDLLSPYEVSVLISAYNDGAVSNWNYRPFSKKYVKRLFMEIAAGRHIHPMDLMFMQILILSYFELKEVPEPMQDRIDESKGEKGRYNV